MNVATLRSLAVEGGLTGGPFGSNLVSRDYEDSGVPVIRGVNMTDRFVGGDFVYVGLGKFTRDLTRNNAQSGDLVFTQRGTLGQVAMVPETPYDNYVISQSQMRLRVDKSKADARFVYYACTATEFLSQVDDHAIATGVPHINLGILGRLTIPCPPPVVQRAIAEVLGTLDDKIAANERVVAAAADLGRAEYEQVMGTTRAEERATLADLARLGHVSYGDGYRTKRSEHASSGFRILRAGDVSGGRIMSTGADFVDRSFASAIGSKTARAGDVVLTTKGTVGRVGVVPDDAERIVYSPQVCYFRVGPAGGIDGGYLLAWLLSQDLQRQIKVRMFKSDMAPYVNLKDIGSLEVPSISVEAQAQIGSGQVQLQSIRQFVDRETSALVRTRDELLPLLMSGKLRVQDAERVVDEVV